MRKGRGRVHGHVLISNCEVLLFASALHVAILFTKNTSTLSFQSSRGLQQASSGTSLLASLSFT
jgi:hypothetical protein